MEMEEELRKISLRYDIFEWNTLRLELVEILIIIVENYDKGNYGIFTELFASTIDDNFASDGKKLISKKLNELKNLGLVHTTNVPFDNRTVHIPNTLKKILLKNFPEEVKVYNEFKIEILAKIQQNEDNSKITSTFQVPNNFKLKSGIEYKLIIENFNSVVKIIIEEN